MFFGETQPSHILCVCRPAEEPTTWGGYLGKVLMASTTYLPSQVTEMFTQGRAFATVRLPFCGHKNICALAVWVFRDTPIMQSHRMCDVGPQSEPEWEPKMDTKGVLFFCVESGFRRFPDCWWQQLMATCICTTWILRKEGNVHLWSNTGNTHAQRVVTHRSLNIVMWHFSLSQQPKQGSLHSLSCRWPQVRWQYWASQWDPGTGITWPPTGGPDLQCCSH